MRILNDEAFHLHVWFKSPQLQPKPEVCGFLSLMLSEAAENKVLNCVSKAQKVLSVVQL